MTEADKIFSKFPDFIKEFIYRNNWTELRGIQIDAADVIFNTDANLLLSSSTASGKTEAAFFPIITDILDLGNFGRANVTRSVSGRMITSHGKEGIENKKKQYSIY